MHQLWNQIPFLFRLQGLLLVIAGFATIIVVNVFAHQGYQRVTFAIPAAERPSLPWHDQVGEFGTTLSRAFGVSDTTAREFAGWILEASQRQQIDAELLASLVFTESTFRKEALSPVGAVGPAQVRPHYWSAFCGSSDLLDPAENIYCGAQILSYLRDRCGDEICALQAYNIGMYSDQLQAARRYVAKIDWARDRLRSHAL